VNGLRSLLRLEDKVAAEGRRLQNLGADASPWGALTLLAAVAILHGAMLMLPALHVTPAIPAASPAPDFPRVWRLVPPPSPPPAQPPPPSHPDAVTQKTDPVVKPPPRAVLPRPFSTEPVPEPTPEIAMSMITAEVEANIPGPDALPPSLEPGPPSSSAAVPEGDDTPRVVVQPRPLYPVAARSLGVEGQVRLRLSVLPDGAVERAAVVACSRPGVGFEAAALEAVKRWRYEPAAPGSARRIVVVTVQFKKQDAHP
jgi:protein TonB